jgi:hypothetical protein
VNRYSLTHVPDPVLLRELRALVSRECATTAMLVAHLAEVDARKLYLPAAHPSMFSYCVQELRLSEDAAYKRIQAARTARRFPAIFPALADGRLNLTGVLLLGPRLAAANTDELLCAARKTKSEIEEWLAQRFPRSESLPLVTALPEGLPPDGQLAPERVAASATLAAPVAGQPSSTDWGQGLAQVSDWTVGPDGALWYCRQSSNYLAGTGDIRRIVHTGDASTRPPSVPTGVKFSPPRPTPAIGRVTLHYTLNAVARVSLAIFDASGRRVRLLEPPQQKAADRYDVTWDGRDDGGRTVSPGLCFARLEVAGRALGQRVPLLR